MARLADKVALITGAGSGIGAATAKLFASEGAKVLVGDVTLDLAAKTVDVIRSAGGEATAIAADISDENQVKAMVQAAIAAYGRIDVLHNNAALTSPAFMANDTDVVGLDVGTWDKTFAVNLRGPMLVSKYVLPHMLIQKSGSVIFTGSGKGSQGDLNHTAYGVAKAGLATLAKYIAAQYGKEGVRSNVIIVGLVLSDTMQSSFQGPVRDMIEGHHLTPYLGNPEHIANTALFLASDESAFVTGAEIPTDGGFTSHAPLVAEMRNMLAPQTSKASH